MKKYKSLRAYAGDLCKREGGLSEAKVGDVVQIINMVTDDIFYGIAPITKDSHSYYAKFYTGKNFKVENLFHFLLTSGARRHLKREKELKRNKKSK